MGLAIFILKKSFLCEMRVPGLQVANFIARKCNDRATWWPGRPTLLWDFYFLRYVPGLQVATLLRKGSIIVQFDNRIRQLH